MRAVPSQWRLTRPSSVFFSVGIARDIEHSTYHTENREKPNSLTSSTLRTKSNRSNAKSRKISQSMEKPSYLQDEIDLKSSKSQVVVILPQSGIVLQTFPVSPNFRRFLHFPAASVIVLPTDEAEKAQIVFNKFSGRTSWRPLSIRLFRRHGWDVSGFAQYSARMETVIEL